MFVSAIIVAAGKGERLGAALPKQFLDLGHGRTMVDLCVETFRSSQEVSELIVAVPVGWLRMRTVPIATRPEKKGTVPISPSDPGVSGKGDCPLFLVEGGARRQDSVARALAHVSADADIVVIHDAARPFVTPSLVDRTVEAAQIHGAALAAVPATDTVKQIGPRDATGSRIVRTTLPREGIFLAQTPQAFRRDVLVDAMSAAHDIDVTDEATLVERAGFPVHVVEGDPANIKVTTGHDLHEARRRLAEPVGNVTASWRIGNGYDLHRLVEGRPLILAGVRIPFHRGLDGHSDADIVCHAVTDAILGAAGAGDIGRLFPDSEPAWRGANSVELLRMATQTIHEAGFRVGNVDVTVIAERPRLLPHLDAMRHNLAAALGIDVTAVSIKGKTNETVGPIGRGEAMACHAVALLVRT